MDKTNNKELNFEDLNVYHRSINFCNTIFKITKEFPKQIQFSLADQLRKVSLSICNNIAEGCDQYTIKEKNLFYNYALNSAREYFPGLEIALKQNLITDKIYSILREECLIICKMLKKLIISLDKNRVKNLAIFLFFFELLTFNFQLTNAAFQNTNWSVSAESMGGIAVAKNEESFSIFYNPACLSNVANKSIQFAYYQPYFGLENVSFSIGNIAFAVPMKSFSVGIGFGSYNVNNLYYETTTILSLSTNLRKISLFLPYLLVGTNLKLLAKGYNFDDEILRYEPNLKNKSSVSSFSLDIGLNYKLLKEKLLLGFSLKDLNQPNVAVTDSEDILPMTFCLGSAYNFGDIKAGLYFEDFTLAIEIRHRNQSWGEEQSKLFYALGIETFLNFHTIALRAGINKDSINFGFGYHGIKISKFTLVLNYGFGISTVVSDNFGNHRLSFELQF